MGYATRTDVENVFGKGNVTKWADVEGENNATFVTTRVTEALSYADERVDDMLRDGPYVLPLQKTDGTTPRTVRDCAAKLAGLWLYESRGIREEADESSPSPLSRMAKNVERTLDSINAGLIRLDVPLSDTNGFAPSGVTVDDEEE